MTSANEGGWPQLPPPDLSEAYAGLPRTWKVGAVLLADRILAAAYREDVCEVATRVQRDVEQGAVRDMTLDEYLEEATEGHQRVVDRHRALQVLAYSPSAEPPEAQELIPMPNRARLLFRLDVEAELERRGVELE